MKCLEQQREVTDWSSQSVDYEIFRKLLRKFNKKPTTDTEHTPLLQPSSNDFFDNYCNKELQKVELFFTVKLCESLVRLSQLEASLQRVNRSDHELNGTAGNKMPSSGSGDLFGVNNRLLTISLAVGKLSQDAADLYDNLVLLRHYQISNIDTFLEISERHDRIRCSDAGSRWFLSHVKQTSFCNVERISNLIADTKILCDQLANGDKSEAISKLYSPESSRFDNKWTNVRIGFFCGTFLVFALFSAVFAWLDRSDHVIDWRPAVQLFRSQLVIVLFIGFIGCNVLGWTASGVRHGLLLDLHPTHRLSPQHYFEIASCLAVVWITMLLIYIVGYAIGIPPFSAPLVVAISFVLFLLNPFRCFYFRSRRWLLRVLLRILLAPFCRVEFADFWMADQLNSLATVFADVEYFICFYAVEVDWNGRDSGKSDSCTPLLKGIVACLPAWFRLAQCLRLYYDTLMPFPHLCNAGKYASTISVVIASSLYAYFGKLVTEDNAQYASRHELMFWLWVVASTLSACYTSLWDVLMDWRLFVGGPTTRGGHVAGIFRRQLLFKRPVYYWIAIVQNLILRFSWTLMATVGQMSVVSYLITKTALAFFEVYRRFVWNFFRLEVEQLSFECTRFMSKLSVTDDDSRPTGSTINNNVTDSQDNSILAPSTDSSISSCRQHDSIDKTGINGVAKFSNSNIDNGFVNCDLVSNGESPTRNES